MVSPLHTTLGNLCSAKRLPVLCSCFSRLCLTSCVRVGAVFKPGVFTVCFWVFFAEATLLLLLIWVQWSSWCLVLNSFALFACFLFSVRILSGREIARSKSSGPWKKYRGIWGDFRWGGLRLDGKEKDWMWVLVSVCCEHISVYVYIHLLFLSIIVNRETPPFPPFPPGAHYLLVAFRLAKDSNIWKWSSV